tara:strand:- start:220 stop:1536 length:1317 start_codon:yes stop_codon:yes gene_type:complete
MKYIKAVALAAATFGLAACGGDNDSSSSEGNAFVRVLHASADAPNVDVLVDGEAALTNVSFQQGSGYISLPEGSTEIDIRVSGTETIAVSAELDLLEGGYYSVIAINDVADLALKVIDDTATFADGDADVRVVHAATVAAEVDIFVTAPDADLSAPTLDAVPFDASAVLEGVAAGDYQVQIAVDATDDLVYDSGSLAVSSDITAVAVNSTKGKSPVSLIVWTASGVIPVLDNSTELRVVHAVDDIDVDVFADEELLIDGFSYKNVEGYLTLEPGTVSVAIAAAGAGIGNALANLSGDLTLERGESYTVIAAGDDGNVMEASLIVLTDQRKASNEANADVRLVHGSSAVPADPVDIYVYLNGTVQPSEPTAADVVLGQDTGYLSLEPNVYTIDITADGTTTPAISGLTDVEVAAGDVKTAIAIGNGSGLSALLLDDSRD